MKVRPSVTNINKRIENYVIMDKLANKQPITYKPIHRSQLADKRNIC